MYFAFVVCTTGLGHFKHSRLYAVLFFALLLLATLDTLWAWAEHLYLSICDCVPKGDTITCKFRYSKKIFEGALKAEREEDVFVVRSLCVKLRYLENLSVIQGVSCVCT